MTLTPEEKKSLSTIRLAKAREFLDDAQAALQEDRHRTSVNRSYYAALNAVRALLIVDGVNPESHEGTITMLSLRFIKTRVLPVSIIKDYKILLARRTDVDYGDFDSIDAEDAGDSLVKAQTIIDTVIKTLDTY